MIVVGSAPHLVANSFSPTRTTTTEFISSPDGEGNSEQPVTTIRSEIATDIMHMLTVAVLHTIEAEVLRLNSAQDINNGIRVATDALYDIGTLARAADELVPTLTNIRSSPSACIVESRLLDCSDKIMMCCATGVGLW